MQLLLGNCLDKLKELEPNSIDAIVTDPPCGLSFMGKKWDYDVPSMEIWKECIRVLKPGGYLLSFAGTRTQHRMAVNIEDAGFEIRDMIAWVYGSGFPKSLNIGKAVDKLQGNEREYLGVKNLKRGSSIADQTTDKSITGWNRPDYPSMVEVTKGTSEWEGWGTALKPAHEPICMARKPKAEYPPVLDVCCGPRMMWFDKQDSRAIYQDKRDVEIKTNPNKAYKNGKTFVIKPDIKGDFSSMGFPDNTFKHVVFDPPHFLETDPDSKMLMRVQYGQLESNWKEIIRKGFAECFRVLQSGGTLVFKWCEYDVPVSEILKLSPVKPLYGHRSGKQSKTHWLVFIKEEQHEEITPNHNPICMARKPLSEKNVAENVLKWGVGGINIDESRVGTEDTRQKTGGAIEGSGWGTKGGAIAGSELGRFPANLIHDGSEEVVELFPQTSPSRPHRNKPDGSSTGTFGMGNDDAYSTYSDSGSASRFFYCAKASKKERNMGCEGLEKGCFHPTVKPVALMEYLVKLVSREGQVVLDPFMGSGTTGMACKKLNREFIGIEMMPEYMEIAKARIEGVKKKEQLNML